MQLRIKNSSTWFSCGHCPNIFPVKNLLTLHEVQKHGVGVDKGSSGTRDKVIPVGRVKGTKRLTKSSTPKPRVTSSSSSSSSSSSLDEDDDSSLPTAKKFKKTSSPKSTDNPCQSIQLDNESTSTLTQGSPALQCTVPSESNSKPSSNDDLQINKTIESMRGMVDTDASSDSSHTIFENGRRESTSGGEGEGLNFLTQPKGKAEPCANFLDHVTTRLAGKRRAFSCNYCGQDLSTVLQVKQHIPLHIDHFHFPCDRPSCPKSFSSRYDQLRHQARHFRKEQKNLAANSSPSLPLSSTPPLTDCDPTLTIPPQPTPPPPPPPQTNLNGLTEPQQERPLLDQPRTYTVQIARFCLCHQVEYGDMVACSQKNCPMEWFHFACVGLTKAPRGPWRCPQCKLKSKGRKKRRAFN